MIFDEAFLRRLESFRLAVRRAIAGRREGERLTRRRGGSSDFVSHRSYTQGDEFRSIDWNLYGRLGQFYVKEFAREEALPVQLLIDTSLSMAPKFEFARRLGAALALVAQEESPAFSVAQIESLKIGAPFLIPPVSRGLLIVVSDLWDEGLRQSLLRSRAEKAVIQVLSREELSPAWEGKVRLVDRETGKSLVRFVGEPERTRYARLLAEHCAAWKKWCFDHDVNYLRCSAEDPLEEVVQVYLREAGVLE